MEVPIYILSTIHIFIPVSGCVGKGPSALLCFGAYNAVKTALGYMLTWLLSYFKNTLYKCKRNISVA